jgi:hypothetical protein
VCASSRSSASPTSTTASAAGSFGAGCEHDSPPLTCGQSVR